MAAAAAAADEPAITGRKRKEPAKPVIKYCVCVVGISSQLEASALGLLGEEMPEWDFDRSECPHARSVVASACLDATLKLPELRGYQCAFLETLAIRRADISPCDISCVCKTVGVSAHWYPFSRIGDAYAAYQLSRKTNALTTTDESRKDRDSLARVFVFNRSAPRDVKPAAAEPADDGRDAKVKSRAAKKRKT